MAKISVTTRYDIGDIVYMIDSLSNMTRNSEVYTAEDLSGLRIIALTAEYRTGQYGYSSSIKYDLRFNTSNTSLPLSEIVLSDIPEVNLFCTFEDADRVLKQRQEEFVRTYGFLPE